MRGRKDNAATGHQEGRCEPVEAQLFGGAAVSDHRAHQSPFNQSLCQASAFCRESRRCHLIFPCPATPPVDLAIRLPCIQRIKR